MENFVIEGLRKRNVNTGKETSVKVLIIVRF